MLNNDDLLKVILADDDDQVVELLVRKHRVKNTADEDVKVEIEIREGNSYEQATKKKEIPESPSVCDECGTVKLLGGIALCDCRESLNKRIRGKIGGIKRLHRLRITISTTNKESGINAE